MASNQAKGDLRRSIALRKHDFSAGVLRERSERILERLEQTAVFEHAGCVALYDALPSEVQTAAFIERWYTRKRILLPVVAGSDLLLVPYTGQYAPQRGAFGIREPRVGCGEVSEAERADLVVVPGLAFDRLGNRLGRGKGFYDRLLSTLSAAKVGICFGFQLEDEVPVEPFDQPVDLVITEDGCFWPPRCP